MTRNKDKMAFGVFILLLLLYSGVFIWQTSFVFSGERYFVLFEDAMVSMSYARNLVRGEGLVMNPGEFVEGYTNPVWTLWMAVAHLPGLDDSKVSLLIQLTGVLILLALVWMVARVSSIISGGKPLAPLLAAIFGVLYFPMIDWVLQGMEVGLAALVVLICIWLALKSLKTGEFSPWLYFVLGFGTLIRQDMTVPYLGIWTAMLFMDRKNLAKHACWGAVFLIFFLGGLTLARYLYYGDFLPNTYYLKLTGYPFFFRITRGISVFAKWLFQKNLIIFFLPFVSLFLRFSREKALLAWVFLLQVAYNIYVGGDAWEGYGDSNRYVTTVMPLFFILFADALDGIRLFLAGAWKNKKAAEAVWGILVFFCFIQVNIPFGIKDLFKISLRFPHLNTGFNMLMVEHAHMVQELTNKDATIAVTSAGALPYFAERSIVDVLGKVDRVIAHRPMHGPTGNQNPYTHFFPGHLKWDYSYSYGELKPDLICHVWHNPSEADPFLKDYEKIYVGEPNEFWYVRKGSPNINWAKLSHPDPK